MARIEDDMSNWNLKLVLDWTTYETPPFYGRFFHKAVEQRRWAPIADFIAADIKGGDTISFSLCEKGNLTVFVNQLIVIFTKQAGAGSEGMQPDYVDRSE